MATKINQSEPFAFQSEILYSGVHLCNMKAYAQPFEEISCTQGMLGKAKSPIWLPWQQKLTNHSHLSMKVRFCPEEYIINI